MVVIPHDLKDAKGALSLILLVSSSSKRTEQFGFRLPSFEPIHNLLD